MATEATMADSTGAAAAVLGALAATANVALSQSFEAVSQAEIIGALLGGVVGGALFVSITPHRDRLDAAVSLVLSVAIAGAIGASSARVAAQHVSGLMTGDPVVSAAFGFLTAAFVPPLFSLFAWAIAEFRKDPGRVIGWWRKK